MILGGWIEDTKEVITICKLKKNRQYNGQKKKNKQRYTKLFILVEFFDHHCLNFLLILYCIDTDNSCMFGSKVE